MMKELKFAIYSIKKNIQSSAELRTSFLTNVIGMAINDVSFIIIWVFFVQSVGVINGWTATDIIALQGFNTLCFGVVFSFGYGIRKIADYVSSGSFDRFMLSPKNLLLRIATSAFGASAIGDIIFGITCFVVYGILAHITFYQAIFLFVLVILSVLVFLSVAITVYSASFILVDASNVISGLFELFISPTIFHGGAFQGGMRFFFTFIIPSLLVGGLPVEIVRDVSLGKLALVAVLAVGWFFLSIKLFNKGVRKYESSNFMTFGNN